MKSRTSGHILLKLAIPLFAAIVGSVLTLAATGKLLQSEANNIATIAPAGVDEAKAVSPIIDDIAINPLDDNWRDDDNYEEFDTALKEASEERAQLAQVLAQLTRQIESLESDIINLQAMGSLQDNLQSGQDRPVSSDFSHSSGGGDRNFGNFGQPLTAQDRVDALVSIGIDLQSAQNLQARQDQYQLARLELFDQAQREGWIESEQFSDRLTELNGQRPDLRAELGDDAYDRYLFEAGQSNRVVIASIIPGSQADIAGLAPGDIVISYANGRVFSTSDLQRATRDGVRGEPVPMDVSRQGQTLFFEVQRGPLGVTLNQDTQSPS
ncbi:MAG: PDZ domain-containing protein [Granulosicoccus sp.]